MVNRKTTAENGRARMHPLIGWLIAMNVLCLMSYTALFVGRLASRRHRMAAGLTAPRRGDSALYTPEYVLAHGSRLPAPDAERLARLCRQTEGGDAIADGDLRWVLSLMNRPPQEYGTEDGFIFAAIRTLRRPSEPQRAIILEQMAPVLTRSDEADRYGFAKTTACTYLTNIKEIRAAPLIRPLLADSRPRVRAYAKRYFVDCGIERGLTTK